MRHRSGTRLTVLCAALGAAVLTSLVGAPTQASAHSTPQSRPTIEAANYDLGAKAFVVPGLLSAKHRNGPMELDGRVYYPSDIGHGTHPLVLMMHGYWETCADLKSQEIYDDPNSAQKPWLRAARLLNQWPCAKGTPPLTSYLGYTYLERALARQGDVVVSIGANGANAIDSYRFQGDEARAALIGKQLHMWRRFVDHDRGPLTGKLPGRLVGHVNMRDVGLLGHSRAGRAVLQYASNAYRSHWPKGVTVRAVLGLAPAGGDPSVDYRDTTTALGLLYGNCDDIAGQASEYYGLSAGHSARAVYRWQVSGANHDYWNTHWSPSSGQVGAYDDATEDPTDPGHCADTTDTSATTHYVRQLKESQQRRYGVTYVGDFFAAALSGVHKHDALLTGRRPLLGVITTTNR